MVVLMRPGSRKSSVAKVLSVLSARGLQGRILAVDPRVSVGVTEQLDSTVSAEVANEIRALGGVEEVESFDSSYKLSDRGFHPDRTAVKVGKVRVGDGSPTIIAGPCAVENRDTLMRTAEAVKTAGADMLRGGAFKPRTSPYSFRGLGEKGLKLLRETSEAFDIPVVTEVLGTGDIRLVADYADVLQIGARNMQNFSLLEGVGEQDRPVLLKRGMSATVRELLLAAEYVLEGGNTQVMLCERGIRTFEQSTRYTLDINSVPLLRRLTHLPVFVDPSHSTGDRELVAPVALAGIAAGADGLIVEVHCEPDKALVDGNQSLRPGCFADLMKKVHKVSSAVGEGGDLTSRSTAVQSAGR
ncbi:3-deoxy-7-phosphoheptulonate synthase [Candidatus Fermentibacteria bacterium]|nr:3-deoxy-7-phosphoheptulonate synthase [Candidatus Fermentibacteria bacterium]